MSSGLNIGMPTAEATRRSTALLLRAALSCFLSLSGRTRREVWYSWGSFTPRSYIRSVQIRKFTRFWSVIISRLSRMTNTWLSPSTPGLILCRAPLGRKKSYPSSLYSGERSEPGDPR